MTDAPVYDLHTTWPQALTLHERGHTPAPPNAEQAERRLRAWREQTAFADDATFARNLAAEDLSLEKLACLLGEDAAGLRARHPVAPVWVDDVIAAYSTLPPDTAHVAEAGFLVFVGPLLEWSCAQLRRRLAALPASPPFAIASAESALRHCLAQHLLPLIERTLVLELHVARLQNLLAGDTPEARFLAFVERLRDPASALAILAEYPVLARHLANKSRQTANAVAELCERLTQDFPALQAQFGPLGTLAEFSLGAGDTHRDGRSVAILRFEDGARLVYKPRSLAVDSHFQQLLTWLNQHGLDPHFRTLSILDRGDYGWVEFLNAAPCATAQEIERFYLRQGGYLALLYMLNAVDFHFENLIAVGEHPMLIDLEALFHPRTATHDPNDPDMLAQDALTHSVLGIGMLPRRLRFYAGAGAIDVSGIAAAQRQMTPDKMPVWEGAGTDEMHLVRRHLEFYSDGHRPELGGQAVDVRQYAGAVARGFEKVYRLLQAHRSEFTAAGGPLAAFNHVEIRFIARATRDYALILQESSHPDLLRHAPDRDRLYSRLWRDLAEVPQLIHLLSAERRDLHNGDVPVFVTNPGSRHLWDSRGEIIADFLPESGMERVNDLIAGMGAEDLARQLWYIRASFAALDSANRHAITGGVRPANTAAPGSADLVAAARAIGDRLCALAHQRQGKAIWIGLGLDDQNLWTLNPLTLHLYDGHAGVAFFLAYLADATGEPRYRELAEAALATVRAQAKPITATFSYLGGFSGWGGLIYTFAHLGRLWRQPDLLAQARVWADLVNVHIDADQNLDVIGGAAGCIGGLAALFHVTEDASLLPLIARCADHLLAVAKPLPQGIGWVVPGMGGAPLAGFSHGAAGFAWALLHAAHLCNNPAYRSAAQDVLRYERTLFDPSAGNWRDLRSQDDAPDDAPNYVPINAATAPAVMYAWCHGAPGVGLARLAMLAHLDDPFLRSEIETALASTAAQGMGGGHSLCHGDLGNIELFVKAAEVLGDGKLLAQAQALTADVLGRQAQTGWICGVPGGVETPGLMVGLAGIGYQLLRLHDPAHLPSLLLMEGPR